MIYDLVIIEYEYTYLEDKESYYCDRIYVKKSLFDAYEAMEIVSVLVENYLDENDKSKRLKEIRNVLILSRRVYDI